MVHITQGIASSGSPWTVRSPEQSVTTDEAQHGRTGPKSSAVHNPQGNSGIWSPRPQVRNYIWRLFGTDQEQHSSYNNMAIGWPETFDPWRCGFQYAKEDGCRGCQKISQQFESRWDKTLPVVTTESIGKLVKFLIVAMASVSVRCRARNITGGSTKWKNRLLGANLAFRP
jgi:hypothetical protein